MCPCSQLKERPLRTGKIMPPRFHIFINLLYTLTLGCRQPFFVKLNDVKFTWTVVLLNLVFYDLNVFLWIWKVGHWNDRWVWVDLLLESEELLVCEYITKPGAGHTDSSVTESCSSEQFWYFKQVWTGLVVILKHVFFSKSQIQK